MEDFGWKELVAVGEGGLLRTLLGSVALVRNNSWFRLQPHTDRKNS